MNQLKNFIDLELHVYKTSSNNNYSEKLKQLISEDTELS